MHCDHVNAALAQELYDVATDELVGIVFDGKTPGIGCAARGRNARPRPQLVNEPLALERREPLLELDVGGPQIADVAGHATCPPRCRWAHGAEDPPCPAIAEDAYSPLGGQLACRVLPLAETADTAASVASNRGSKP